MAKNGGGNGNQNGGGNGGGGQSSQQANGSTPTQPYPGSATPYAPPSPLNPNLSGMAPAPIQAFGPLAHVNPTYAQATGMNAVNVDPASSQQYLNEYEQALNSSMQPQFTQQQQQLEEDLASRGITNSGAAGQLVGNLQGQQSAAIASAEQPMISQAFGYDQQDLTQNAQNRMTANELNQQYANEFALSNQSAANTANQTNASYYNQAQYTNAGEYNQYLNTLENQGYNTYDQELGSYLGSYGPNQGVFSTMGYGLSGAQSGYNSIYGAALGAEGQAMGAAGQAAGYFA